MMRAKTGKRGPEIIVRDGKPRGGPKTIFLGFLLAALLVCTSSLLTWAADGSLLAFLRDDQVWVANSDGTGARQLTTAGQAEELPALSRDGQWVAFTSLKGKRTGISLTPTAGGEVKIFKMPGIPEAWSPAFTPDGRQLAVVTRFNLQTRTTGGEKYEYGTVAVSLADFDTGKVRHLVKVPNHTVEWGKVYENLAVSPDGRFIAYQESGTDVSGAFVVLNLEGKKVLRFPKNPEDYHPFWRPGFSPDGTRMLCFSMATAEGEKTYIYLVDLKTLKATRITEGYYPTFVDGGRAMVFERWTETGMTGKAATKIDLWRLDFAPGAAPRLILENAEKPAGQG
jgi:Tol biopolymer transport system component